MAAAMTTGPPSEPEEPPMRALRSLRWSIFLLGAIGVLATLVVALQSFWFQRQMNEAANQAFVAKDVVADILPPPMYLIELRLVLSQAVEGTLDAEEATRQFKRLATDYQERVDHWTRNPPYGLERQLLGRQHEAARKFLAGAQAEILEPLRRGDTAAARQHLPAIHALYQAHRQGVDETVEAGSRFAAATMTQFEEAHARSDRFNLVIAAVVVAVVLVFYRTVLHSVQQPVQASTRAAQRIAGGDLATPHTSEEVRTDILGELQQALAGMQDNLRSIVQTVRNNGPGHAAERGAGGGKRCRGRNLKAQAQQLVQAVAVFSWRTGCSPRFPPRCRIPRGPPPGISGATAQGICLMPLRARANVH
ncbi:MAG: methyl-accepting chemotaxis protein [Rhodoferax sp.]